MESRKQYMSWGRIFLFILVAGGLVLTFLGNDAISMSRRQKEGILTAEQVNLAFQDIGGRLILENVKEGQLVRQGDLLMQLDSTDTDLAIARLQAQIRQSKGSIDIGLERADTEEEQAYRSIEQAKKGYDAATATFANKELYYRRMEDLQQQGAVSQLELDNARMDLDVCRADMIKAERLLNELLAGTGKADREQVWATDNAAGIYLPLIDQERRSLQNDRYNVESMEVELRELQVQKERLNLLASEDGRILKIIAKQGEMVAVNAPVILLESRRLYYDIYVDEKTAAILREGDTVIGEAVADGRRVPGTIRLLTAAPGFADIRMSRERGQADMASFQVRIYIDPDADILAGMTIRVSDDELHKRRI